MSEKKDQKKDREKNPMPPEPGTSQTSTPSPGQAGEGEMVVTFHPAEPMSSYQDAVLKCKGGIEADYVVPIAHGETLLKFYPEHFTKKEPEEEE